MNIDNERRAELIDKELAEGLTPAEAEELAALQAAADEWLAIHHPLPVENLAWLEERVRQLGAEKGGAA